MGALGTLVLAVPAAALLLHCSSFSASEEAADGGDGSVLVEGGPLDPSDAAGATDASDASDGAVPAFCASVQPGVLCEDFESDSVLANARYEVDPSVTRESPGFRSAHGIVATTMTPKSGAVFAVPSTPSASARSIAISAAIRFDAAPTTEVDLIAVELGGRTMELYVTSNLTVSFASCNGDTCEDLTLGLKKLAPGTYARLELSLDLTGEQVIARGTVDGAAAFSTPVVVTRPASGPTFSSLFGVVYSESSIAVHVDDVQIQAK